MQIIINIFAVIGFLIVLLTIALMIFFLYDTRKNYHSDSKDKNVEGTKELQDEEDRMGKMD